MRNRTADETQFMAEGDIASLDGGAAAIAHAEEPSPPSRMREFWRAYAQNRGALIGLCLVALLILLALGADFIAPDPPNEQYRTFTLAPPAWHADGTESRKESARRRPLHSNPDPGHS